jgi:hypothetical protein
MSLVGDFWTHPNVLYHDALLNIRFADDQDTYRGVQDDLASIVILTVFSGKHFAPCTNNFADMYPISPVIQCYLSFLVVQHLFGQRKLPQHSRKSPHFSIVTTIVFILFFVATLLAIVTFSLKLFAATKVAWYPRGDTWKSTSMYSCALPYVDTDVCPLFFAYTPSPLASQLDMALGAVFQAVVILADGLLVSDLSTTLLANYHSSSSFIAVL